MSSADLDALLDYEEDDEDQGASAAAVAAPATTSSSRQALEPKSDVKSDADASKASLAAAKDSAVNVESTPKEVSSSGAVVSVSASGSRLGNGETQVSGDDQSKVNSAPKLVLSGLASALAQAKKRAEGQHVAQGGDHQAQSQPQDPLSEQTSSGGGTGFSVQASSHKDVGQKGSRTLLVRGIPSEQCDEDKVASHFQRYGPVARVEKLTEEANTCIVEFETTPATTKAFVNRAPVFKNTGIMVYRIADHDAQAKDRKAILAKAVLCPNRKVSKPAMAPASGAQEAATTSVETNVEVNQEGSGAPTNVELEALNVKDGDKGSSNAKTDQGGPHEDDFDLYGNISMEASVSNGGDAKADPNGKRSVEKRTWSRAGLPNMNDPRVIRAKSKERQAANQFAEAKEQVKELMQELEKQKQQFKLVGTDAKTIGQNLRSELMSNNKLLMAQLRHAQTAIARAKLSIAKSKKDLEIALEASKTGEDSTEGNA
mmetsp:Transcript_8512/g.15075  ORF Transcript_8512/g.15075 Transcript_8512/m.15075 type:complete len:486 (-) Transcript_8512:335-1792(-)